MIYYFIIFIIFIMKSKLSNKGYIIKKQYFSDNEIKKIKKRIKCSTI